MKFRLNMHISVCLRVCDGDDDGDDDDGDDAIPESWVCLFPLT